MNAKHQFWTVPRHAFGDRTHPDHTRFAARPRTRQAITAVPLGCGQRASGGAGRTARAAALHHGSGCASCPVRRGKRSLLGHDRKGQVHQLARCGTARHLWRLARCTESVVLGTNDRIEAGCRQGRHIQRRAQAGVAAMPNLGASAHTRTRLVGQWNTTEVSALEFIKVYW